MRMAWAEAALEELGLAQIWVRRGQHAPREEAAHVSAAETGATDELPGRRGGAGAAAPARHAVVCTHVVT